MRSPKAASSSPKTTIFYVTIMQASRTSGIVYSKQGSRTIGAIVRYLKLMHDCLDQEDMAGQLEYF